MNVRNRCLYDRDLVSQMTGFECEDDGRTVQSEAKDTDINVIVKRFGLTGELPISRRVPLAYDFSEGGLDYRDCLDVVRNAQQSFDSMPSGLRARFNNDPRLFVEFASDPANADELRKLGGLPPLEEPAAPAVASPGASAGAS